MTRIENMERPARKEMYTSMNYSDWISIENKLERLENDMLRISEALRQELKRRSMTRIDNAVERPIPVASPSELGYLAGSMGIVRYTAGHVHYQVRGWLREFWILPETRDHDTD